MSKLIAIKKETQRNGYFLLNWMLHDKCTYDCSYCPPSNKAGQDSWLSIDFSKQFIDNLENWLALQGNTQNVVVSFTGGEPTVWPKFIELVDYIRSKNWFVTMTTNGSRSLAWWKENQEKFYKINFSYHSEFADNTDFLEKIKYIANLKSPRHFFTSVMMNPKKWDQCTDMIESLLVSSPLVPFDIRPLQQNFGLQPLNIEPYTEEQDQYMLKIDSHIKIWINENRHLFAHTEVANEPINGSSAVYEDRTEKLNPNEIILKNRANFKNWTCNIGIEQIFVNSLGKIWGGTCLQGSPIGKIQEPHKINWPTGPTICKSSWCGCYTDIVVSKWKNS
jgi:organic radical activating enzyme